MCLSFRGKQNNKEGCLQILGAAKKRKSISTNGAIRLVVTVCSPTSQVLPPDLGKSSKKVKLIEKA